MSEYNVSEPNDFYLMQPDRNYWRNEAKSSVKTMMKRLVAGDTS